MGGCTYLRQGISEPQRTKQLRPQDACRRAVPTQRSVLYKLQHRATLRSITVGFWSWWRAEDVPFRVGACVGNPETLPSHGRRTCTSEWLLGKGEPLHKKARAHVTVCQ